MAKFVNRLATYLILLCCFAVSVPVSTVLAVASVDHVEEVVAGHGETVEPIATITADEGPLTEPDTSDLEAQPAVVGDNLDQPTNSDAIVPHRSEPDEPPADSPQYAGLVLTRVQTRSGLSASSELIELRNNSMNPIDITGWRLYYTSASPDWKTAIVVVDFTPSNPAIGWRVTLGAGQYLLYVTDQYMFENPETESSGVFRPTLANSGRLVIEDNLGQIQGGLAWGGNDTPPVEGAPVAGHQPGGLIARKLLQDGWHQHTRHNFNDFDVDAPAGGLFTPSTVSEEFDACLNIAGISDIVPADWYRDDLSGNCSQTPPEPMNSCQGLIISEVGANLSQQFIELHNTTDDRIKLDGCQVATNHTASKPLIITDLELPPKGYHVITIEQTDLRLNKTTSSTVYIIDEAGKVEVDVVSYANLKPNTSWSLDDGEWTQTYEPTPGEPNIRLLFPSCEAGYVRNLETGRCNKIDTDSSPAECASNQFRNPETGRCKLLASTSSELTPCKPGQFRNPETNRCKSLSTTSSSLQPCAEGQFRNPETNRCKKIEASGSTLKPCQPGYERNPETNRCRKSTSTAAVSGADFPVEPIKQAGNAFLGWWALGGVLCFGLAYAGWEWRHEIINTISRART